MCGLFGWMAKAGRRIPRRSLATLARSLWDSNDDRGGDSWGFFGSGMPEPKKGLGLAARMNGWQGPQGMPAAWCMAHTRKATTGKVAVANSHPFRCGKLIGMHNGMALGNDWMNKSFGRECEVDSQHLFHHIDEGLPLSSIDAYGTIVFHDDCFGDSLFLGTFNEGEIAVRETKDAFVWSSAAGHLWTAMVAAGMGPGKRVNILDGFLHEVSPTGLRATSMPLDFDSPWMRVSSKKEALAKTGMSSSTVADSGGDDDGGADDTMMAWERMEKDAQDELEKEMEEWMASRC